jgi:hypothetical protein
LETLASLRTVLYVSPDPRQAEIDEERLQADRLLLIAQAERERLSVYNKSRRSRSVFVVTFGLLAGAIVLMYFTAPRPPVNTSVASDARGVTLAVASGIDNSAASAGVSSAEFVRLSGPQAIATAAASQSSSGISLAQSEVKDQTLYLHTTAGLLVEVELKSDKAELRFAADKTFCIKFASLPKAASQSSDSAC